MQAVFITGTDTDIGKTVVAAIVAEALQAGYWKPVQCGNLDGSDSIRVGQLISQPDSRILPEFIRLEAPMSPHAAADLESQHIDPASICLPDYDGELVIEGAGGLMVPLNHTDLYVDWVRDRGIPAILVSGNRLGSINHTMLSIEALRSRNIPVAGLIFNGPPAPTSESFIIENSGLPVLARVPKAAQVNSEFVRNQAEAHRESLRRGLKIIRGQMASQNSCNEY